MGRNMFVITTTAMVKTKELSTGTRESTVTLRDSGDSRKGCNATSMALGVRISTARDTFMKEREHHAVAHVKGRGRKFKTFL